MPSFQDSAVIFIIALLLFGPKKLPELARQLGKLMGEFRRASNDFRMQMEDELRMAEQADRQKKIAEIEAAAPTAPALTEGTPEYTVEEPAAPAEAAEVVPIASEGDLKMMPPDTGLPVGRGAYAAENGSADAQEAAVLTSLLDSIPEAPAPETHAAHSTQVDQHG